MGGHGRGLKEDSWMKDVLFFSFCFTIITISQRLRELFVVSYGGALAANKCDARSRALGLGYWGVL